MSAVVEHFRAYAIFDSRGKPTLRAVLRLKGDFVGEASVPSGASTGNREALELRDGDPDVYDGQSVFKAINHANQTIASLIQGQCYQSQQDFDQALIRLDGSEKKSRLGANTILAASLAFAQASAAQRKQPLYRYIQSLSQTPCSLPMPMLNVINGGAHADNGLRVQEFMMVPLFCTRFSDAMHCSFKIFHRLKSLLVRKRLATGVGDEGGFAPALDTTEQAIELLLEAIEAAGYVPQEQVAIALDIASTEFYDPNRGRYMFEEQDYESEQMVELYRSWLSRYPIVSIEDGLAEDDTTGWKRLTDCLGKRVQLVGDDLFTTDVNSLQAGIETGMANSILLKINQIGTLTETLSAHALAQKAGYGSIISHRSGETGDAFIADLAVGCNAGQIKTGSFCRSDRMEKYNRLLCIEADNPDFPLAQPQLLGCAAADS